MLNSGSMVYLNVDSGLMPEAPLFGVVDFIDGTPPNLVRVGWNNGTSQLFATVTQSINRLVDFTDVTGTIGDAHPSYGRDSSIMRVMSSSVNGIKKLVQTADGRFFVMV